MFRKNDKENLAYHKEKSMKQGIGTFLFLTLFICVINIIAFGKAYSAELFGEEVVPNNLIIKFTDDVRLKDKMDILSETEANYIKAINTNGFNQLTLSEGTDLLETMLFLAGRDEIEFIQPNYVYRTTALNDPFYYLQWPLKNNGQTITGSVGVSGADLDAEAAWEHTSDCRGVVVAVLDTGVNYIHEDLVSNMWNGTQLGFPYSGYDFVKEDNDPQDLHGHGTHVAGIIGNRGNNSLGSSGLCQRAEIMAVRVMGADGSGSSTTINAGINFAVENGAKVINMSVGGFGYDFLAVAAIFDAQVQGVLIIAAAGNEGKDNELTPLYPCNYPLDNIICVAALDNKYQLASYSNFGSTSVDIAAPGTSVVSGSDGDETTTNYSLSSGWTNTNWTSTSTNCPGGFTPCFVSSSSYPNGYSLQTFEAYRNFNFSPNKYLVVKLRASYNLLSANRFQIYANPTASAPFNSSGLIEEEYGNPGSVNPGLVQSLRVEIEPDVAQSSFNLGFRYAPTSSSSSLSVGFSNVSIGVIDPSVSTYVYLSGTSMATPYVAALATMIYSYNPTYTYSDVKEAILGGGETLAILSGKVSSGKTINAMGSLSYIKRPTGLTAVKKP